MRWKKIAPPSVLVITAALLSSPVSSQYEKEYDGSRRKVLTCNVDGTYTCANETCRPGYCCQIGG